MRRFAALLLAFAFVSTVAFAGDGGCPAGGGGSKGGCPMGGDAKGKCPMGGDAKGGGCPNECPLAQDAASHRSNGEEAVFASKTIRAEYVKGISKAIADL
jgi:hypothetical protein